jgi:BirA family biotin operon repressor/biotin-[acetyl-CoA-carboxylase] ligase
VGLAASAAIESVAPAVGLAIKWPNDLMLGERKVGGILCEARWQGAGLGWIAVGLGLNVQNRLPDEVVPNAAALAAVAPALTPDQLIVPMSTALRALRREPAGLTAAELQEFERRDWLKGRAVVEPEQGTAEGIEPDGRLRVRRGSGELVLVRSGSVVLHT